MRMRTILMLFVAVCVVSPAASQLGLPVGQTVDGMTGAVRGTLDEVRGINATAPVRSVTQLARDRVARLTALVRGNRDTIAFDDQGQPARKGVVLLLDPTPEALAVAQKLGFGVAATDRFNALGLGVTELIVPEGIALADAVKRLRSALPRQTITADQLHFQSGGATARGNRPDGASAQGPPIAAKVGIIDSGVAPMVSTVGAKGFVRGAPAPGDHGTAIASLLSYAGVRNIVSADVYGRDPAGGNALSIVRALDWMATQQVPVVSISLVGPRNPLLERAVAAVVRRGTIIVAAVGNDGPSAPPAYPASYSGVMAITGVDGRDRVLIEAGRASHLDYAAPAADMRALDATGRNRAVRGTSFAVPLAAARIAAASDRGKGGANLRATLDQEARDLGKKGPDAQFGRGLLCASCRRH